MQLSLWLLDEPGTLNSLTRENAEATHLKHLLTSPFPGLQEAWRRNLLKSNSCLRVWPHQRLEAPHNPTSLLIHYRMATITF